MWNFQIFIERGHRHHFTGDPVQTGMNAVFQPPRRHQLHAHADAQKRLGLFYDVFLQRFLHAIDRAQAIHAIAECALSRQNDAGGFFDVLRPGGNLNLKPQRFFSRNPLERLRGGT